MDFEMFGMKELYDVSLKATSQIEIGNRTIVENEIVALFENVTIANIDEIKTHKAATGGFDNRSHVSWDEVKEITFQFSQGIFSKTQLAILGNSHLTNKNVGESILVPKIQLKESDASGEIELAHIPYNNEVFIYNISTGEKLSYTLVDNIATIATPYLNVRVNYNYSYVNGATIIQVGRPLVKGYLKLEGKTRVKDDTTGQIVTGILSIPRLKLMSDLSMRLGEDANPLVGSFIAVGYPVGTKGNKEVFKLSLLNDDIDSDL